MPICHLSLDAAKSKITQILMADCDFTYKYVIICEAHLQDIENNGSGGLSSILAKRFTRSSDSNTTLTRNSKLFCEFLELASYFFICHQL